MTWRPVDCHAHSTLSDGALTVREIAERGEALGVQPSVSDHISRDVAVGPREPDEVARYLDELERYPVLRGGEFCWHDELWRELDRETVTRFTHRIGSLHAVHLAGGDVLHAFSRRVPDGLSPALFMDAFAANVERLGLEMPVDILAHPTLLPIFCRGIAHDELWTDDIEDRVVRALKTGAIAFEISARYRPHERLVRRAVDAGVRISLGSDGHSAEQVANVAWPLAVARSLGVRDADLYDPRVHGSRTGHFDRARAG